MIRERIVETNDDVGTFHIVKQQDCDQILKAIQEIPDHYRRKQDTKTARKYFCTIPNIIAVSWAREWGVNLYGKEWLEAAHKRVKHDPNWSKLRIKW